MRLLVSGGAGFIGSNFVHYFSKNYQETQIVILDKLTYCGRKVNLKGLDIEFIKGDIADSDVVSKAMKGADICINFAAESHVDRSIRKPQEFIRTNIMGVRVLLDAAREYNIKRFIQISTDEVYGEVLKGSSKETDKLSPRNPYSASKAAADLLCLAYFNTYNTPVIITRSCNNFGHYQYPEKLIPLFATNLLKNKKIPVYGDGGQVREWIYVEDNCRAIDLVIKKGKLGEVYNIGTSWRKKNIEIANLILEALGRDEGMISFVKDRLGHDKRYSVNSGKIRSLGWKPKYTFKKSLENTIDWYINNEWWWKELKKI